MYTPRNLKMFMAATEAVSHPAPSSICATFFESMEPDQLLWRLQLLRQLEFLVLLSSKNVDTLATIWIANSRCGNNRPEG